MTDRMADRSQPSQLLQSTILHRNLTPLNSWDLVTFTPGEQKPRICRNPRAIRRRLQRPKTMMSQMTGEIYIARGPCTQLPNGLKISSAGTSGSSALDVPVSLVSDLISPRLSETGNHSDGNL